MKTFAFLSIASSVVSLCCLLALHVLNPEFQPSWRMVSEYALGKHKRVLTAFFFCWGASSILLAVPLWSVISGVWASVGVILLVVSGIGAIMGGLYDVQHKWHGMAFGLGIPTLLVGSLLIAYNVLTFTAWAKYDILLLCSTHAVWLSCVIMGASMAVMFSWFKKAGIAWDKDAEPPSEVPAGVIAVGGYANRLVVLCYEGWAIIMAYIYLSQ